MVELLNMADLMNLVDLLGISCNIGNAPNLVGKKLKTVICVFWMYI
jgi:hypothetical protein